MPYKKTVSIEINYGWITIFIAVIKKALYRYFIFIYFIIVLDLFLLRSGYLTLFPFILLFYCIMVSNHEYGHYIFAKKLIGDNKPIKIVLCRYRSYIVYSLDEYAKQEEVITLVRVNAVIFDILSIIISVIISSNSIILRIIFMAMTILNMFNYFILTEGSDGYVIYNYVKKWGIKKLLKLYFTTIRRIKWTSC